MQRGMYNRVLPVSKSVGVSTYDCIRSFKRITRIKKVGHAGSLDPIARGLILLLTGEATKLSNYLMDLPKRYIADIRMGEATDTQDASGRVVETGEWEHVDEEGIRRAIPEFLGKRLQTPPMYSALKHRGTPLYTLARRGQKVERRPREVETYEIELQDFTPPVFRIAVFCSRGLYVRVLAEEIGRAVGVPSTLQNLVRTNIGHFTLEEAVPDDAFGTLLDSKAAGYSLAEAIRHMLEVRLSGDQARRLETGIAPRIKPPDGAAARVQGTLVRMVGPDGSLGAIGEIVCAGQVKIRRVFKENEG